MMTKERNSIELKGRYAPSGLESLDFERVVNSYSVAATRARLCDARSIPGSVCLKNEGISRHQQLQEQSDSELQSLLDPHTPDYKSFEGDEEISPSTPTFSHAFVSNKEKRDCNFFLRSRNDLLSIVSLKSICGFCSRMRYSSRTILRCFLTFLIGLIIGSVTVFIMKATDAIVSLRERGLNVLEKAFHHDMPNLSGSLTLGGNQFGSKNSILDSSAFEVAIPGDRTGIVEWEVSFQFMIII